MNILRNLTGAFLIVLIFAMIPSEGLRAAQLLFTPGLDLSEEYTDNIFLSSQNQQDDYITTAGLNLELQYLSRTAGLELFLMPSYSSFADNNDLSYWRYAGRLRLYNEFSQTTRLEVTNDYLDTQNPRDRSANYTPNNPLQGPVINTDLTRRGRNRYRTDVTRGQFTHQFGPRDHLSAAMEYSFLEDVDTFPGQAVADYTIWQPSLSMEYWFTQRWGILMDGYYSNRDYVDRNDREEYYGSLRLQHALRESLTGFMEYRHTALKYDQPTDDDYQIYEPSIGMTYQFQQEANITVSAGYYVQDYEHQDKIEGWVVNSAIYKRWSFATSYISFTGSSGYQIRDRGAQDLGLNIFYQGSLDAGYNFTALLSANVFGSYRQDQYKNRVPELTDDTINAGAGLNYQALQWMNISLTYNYNSVVSDVPDREYTENSVILTIRMRPSAPYRLN